MTFSFKPTAVSNMYEQYPTRWFVWMLCGRLVIAKTSYLHVIGLNGMHILLYQFMPAISYSYEIFFSYSAPSILNLDKLFDTDFFPFVQI